MDLLVLRNFLENIDENYKDSISPKFSINKTLYGYQIDALESVYKLLRLYYKDFSADKQKFFEAVYKDKVREYLNINVKGKRIKQYLSLENDKIHFSELVNRASFWMATGSGKTLIIIKLIELLKQLMDNGDIPKKDILFLTARDDLLEQFIKHIDEYNSSNSLKIGLIPLSDYEKAKTNRKLDFPDRIEVFYYRSDLITDESGDKKIDFETVYNNGEWYLILDEAHKGDKTESKRQAIFTILTQRGFMFNFSATFIEDIDLWTCAYNFNLEKFIQKGYGKDIYISEYDIKPLGKKEEFTQEKKKEIVLRILIILTALKQIKQEIGNYYHKPMLVALVNSVNTDDSDLEMFFKVLEDIAKNPIGDELLNKVKEELKEELRFAKTEFRNQEITNILDKIEKITEKDILLQVFNSEHHSKIEVKVLPNNKQEMALSLKTSSKPFALIKIGDITGWIKEKLRDYEIVESFDNESLFKQLNDDNSDINILLGSRSFYEGWDSNRPNIILYINIGNGKSAKKFVLQSIGRGVRVSPVKNKRKIWDYLANEINHDDFTNFKKHAYSLETLYVYGTKADNLRTIVKTVKEQKTEECIGDLFEINPEIEGKTLLIPVYKEKKPLWGNIKFKISKDDINVLENYIRCIPDVVFLVKYEVNPSVLKNIKESLDKKDEYYDTDTDIIIGKPDVIVRKLVDYYLAKMEHFDKFKTLEDEIIHFKHITVSKDKAKEIKEIIGRAKKQGKNKSYKSDNHITVDFKCDEILKHYYLPVAVSDTEKVDFINHIIKEESEYKFINRLEEYLEDRESDFENIDWWYFSKIDESLDKIYIPYTDGNLRKFYPDFIFWFKKKNEEKYAIIFVDPKGTEHTQAYRKIDGYKAIFTDNDKPKVFSYQDAKVVVGLLFMKEEGTVLSNYKEYWISNVKEIFNKAEKLLVDI